jgi:hypothetical protein
VADAAHAETTSVDAPEATDVTTEAADVAAEAAAEVTAATAAVSCHGSDATDAKSHGSDRRNYHLTHCTFSPFKLTPASQRHCR